MLKEKVVIYTRKHIKAGKFLQTHGNITPIRLYGMISTRKKRLVDLYFDKPTFYTTFFTFELITYWAYSTYMFHYTLYSVSRSRLAYGNLLFQESIYHLSQQKPNLQP